MKTKPDARPKGNRPLLAGLVGIALLVAGVLGAGVLAARRRPPDNGSVRWGPTWPVTTGTLFGMFPRRNAILLDEEIYLGTLQGVRRGGDFYESQNALFNANSGRWNTFSPLTYRQPLLTWVWRALGSGTTIGMVFAGLAAVAMVAAWIACCEFVEPSPALIGPLSLGLVFVLALLHPPRILYSETWAGPPLVIANALCALALVRPSPTGKGSRAPGWLDGLGAIFALLALMIRELSIVPVVILLTAVSIDRAARARRAWVPWAMCLVIWAGLYARHVQRVAVVSRGDPAPPLSQGGLLASFFQPGWDFLFACVRWESTAAGFVPLVVLAAALAIAGACTLKGAALRVLVGGSTLGVLVLLLLVGTPGVFSEGSRSGYWGYLFVPLVLAWSPLGLRAWSGKPSQK